MTDMELRENSFKLYALNEKGKEKCIIDVNMSNMYNMDLAVDVAHMIQDKLGENHEE